MPNILSLLDGEQLLDDLENLAQIGLAPSGGMNRVAYNEADMAGRCWSQQRMEAIGLTTRMDAAGNVIGLYPGTQELRPIAIGSHTDTVPNGGRYDGALGVLAALSCVRTLHSAGVRLRHPVEVINFAAEEATMAGGTTGSLAMCGVLTTDDLQKAAWDGRPVAQHLQDAGLAPIQIEQAQRSKGSLSAYLELHVEQSQALELSHKSIAVVEGIVGIRRYEVTFEGYANHAGTTPMHQRQDALVAAAPYITFVRECAISNNIVGTVGTLAIQPGASNVIPGQVNLSVEIRGLDDGVLDHAQQQLRQEAERSSGGFQQVSRKDPVQSDPRIIEAFTTACQHLELSYLQMPSGAGHDAMNMEAICPQGMIFVPSKDGVSHSPDEYTAPEDCVNGARVLLAALLKLDELLD